MRPLVLFFLAAATALAAPCTSVAACTEWVTLAGGPSRSLIYRTYPLDTPNSQITRALIMIHGASRDADNYFRTALAAAFLAGALDDTIVISPRFASRSNTCQDTLALNEVSYSCTGDSWRSGGTSTSNEKITSYDFTDELLRKLARKEVFPNLKSIVVAGHSAGGQYVNRYEMSNLVHDTLHVPVTYVVSNPSSYAYLDATRPAAELTASCKNFDRWPYGLESRTGGYTAKQSDEQLMKQLAARPVTYLLGEIDILPLGGFDASCSAMTQGPTRLARGQSFGKFVNEKYGAKHTTTVVSLCGHNARCMFTAESALPILFPTQ